MRTTCLLILLSVLLPAPSQAHPGTDVVVEYFNKQIKEHPGEQPLYVQRGIAYSEAGHYEEALADFRHAATLGDPYAVDFELGLLYYRMDQPERARVYLDQLLQRFPDHTRGLEYRAKVLRDLDDIPAALADLQHLLNISDRPNPAHYISAAQMLASTGATGVVQAINTLDAGIAKLGLTPQLQEYAINLELTRLQPEAAIERQRSLQPMLGDSPAWKVDLAELLMDAGQRDEAASLLKSASSQLETLRRTPARIKLSTRITALSTGLDPEPLTLK